MHGSICQITGSTSVYFTQSQKNTFLYSVRIRTLAKLNPQKVPSAKNLDSWLKGCGIPLWIHTVPESAWFCLCSFIHLFNKHFIEHTYSESNTMMWIIEWVRDSLWSINTPSLLNQNNVFNAVIDGSTECQEKYKEGVWLRWFKEGLPLGSLHSGLRQGSKECGARDIGSSNF